MPSGSAPIEHLQADTIFPRYELHLVFGRVMPGCGLLSTAISVALATKVRERRQKLPGACPSLELVAHENLCGFRSAQNGRGQGPAQPHGLHR